MTFQAPFDIVDMRNQQMREEQMKQEQAAAQQEQMGAAIASLAGQFAQNRQAQAKADAYGDFLGMHGETLGFKPEWLAEFKKKPRDQQIQLGDMLIGSFIPHQQRMDYANTIMARRATPAAGGGAGGGMLHNFDE